MNYFFGRPGPSKALVAATLLPVRNLKVIEDIRQSGRCVIHAARNVMDDGVDVGTGTPIEVAALCA